MADDHADPAGRALALLSSLTGRAHWSGTELAARLGVTTRTVRRDVDRLRRLGYEIEASSGTEGGYRLRAGAVVPPLFLDADEAVAVVTALLAAAGNATTGMVDASTRALAKLHHVLPAAVQGRAEAVRRAARIASIGQAPAVDPTRVATLAESCRDGVAIRFDYRARDGRPSRRRVEPNALVTVRSVWYLVAYDLDRRDWRAFRVDRIGGEIERTGHGVTRRTVPGGDPVTFLGASLAEMTYVHTATMDLAIDRDAALARLAMAQPDAGRGDRSDGSCRIQLGAADLAELTRQVVDVMGLGATTTLRGPDAVRSPPRRRRHRADRRARPGAVRAGSAVADREFTRCGIGAGSGHMGGTDPDGGHDMKRTTSKTAWLVAPVVLTVSVVGLGEPVAGDGGPPSSGPPDTYVAAWDAVGAQAFTAAALSPAEGHTIFGYVGVAVYDAVMAVEGGYEPFAIDVDAPDGASPEAAVAAAARRILVHHLPGQAALIIEPAYTASLNTIADGQAKTDGIAAGDAVASQLIALRSGDGFRAPATYTPPNPPIPGVWLPTAPTPPIGPYLGLMDPFSLPSADQFRPGGPPPLDSKRWADDYNEVKEIGSATSATRTGDQTVAARFWGEAPVQQARGSFRKFVLDHQLDIVDAARFNAMWSVTYADALIACFDAKYTYTLWRPITAIRAGETDGNDATLGDPTWTPLLRRRRTIPSTPAPTRASPPPADESSPGSLARHRSTSPCPASASSTIATSPPSGTSSTR